MNINKKKKITLTFATIDNKSIEEIRGWLLARKTEWNFRCVKSYKYICVYILELFTL